MDAANVKIALTELHRADVIAVEGSINTLTTPEFEAALNQRLDQGRHNLVVDLEGVNYLSSAGLRALIAALKRAQGAGGNLALAAPSARVREVIELAGLTNLFPMYDDRVSAVGSF